jgi:hypothetical protein
MTPRRNVRLNSGSSTGRLLAATLAVVVGLGLLGLWGCESGLPEEDQVVRDVLRTDFPGWRLVTARDLSADQQRQWAAEHPGQQPGLASGSYFGETRKAYAALLTMDAKEGRRMRVVVLKPTPEGARFEALVLFSESPVDSTPQIFTSKAGEYQVFLEGKSVPVPTEGVVYAHGAGQQKLFFWNVERFQDVELTP